jgi:ABC-type transport system involved in cytochrome c biogenesis ATPase subunit
MADLDAVLEQLKKERERAEGELKQLDKAIATLSQATTRSKSSMGHNKGMKPRLSAAARERIAAAQRARWAKVREKAKSAVK